jgi:hypothetical protein
MCRPLTSALSLRVPRLSASPKPTSPNTSRSSVVGTSSIRLRVSLHHGSAAFRDLGWHTRGHCLMVVLLRDILLPFVAGFLPDRFAMSVDSVRMSRGDGWFRRRRFSTAAGAQRRPRRTEPWADRDVGGGLILEESESPLLLRPIERQGTNEPAHGDTGAIAFL